MRHTPSNVINATLGGAFNQLIEERDDRFATLERKSLLSEILRVQKPFKLFRGYQFPSQLLLDLDG
jgi:hypothetical protein